MTGRPTRGDRAGAAYLALQRLARAGRRPTAELLQLFVLEGFLRRIARSRHAERLVLKGGLLLAAFDLRRATRDVDLLALRADNSPEAVGRTVAEVAAVDVEDGVSFLPGTVVTETIREGDTYAGVRASLQAHLATARISLGVDVNVGDPVVPAPRRTAVPALLGGEPVEIWAYPPAMVVAEKLVTALQRGRANTRWRDFADLCLLVTGPLSGADVVAALRAVAAHRGVALRPLGEALAGMAPEAQAMWTTDRTRRGADGRVPADFAAALDAIDAATRDWLHAAARPSAEGPEAAGEGA